MGSGTAKKVRLDLGIELRTRVHKCEGTDEDILLVQEEAPDFMDGFARQIVERARLIRGDRNCFRLTSDDVMIQLPALKRPTLAGLQQDWGYIDRIERDDSTEEPVTLRLATVLKSDESSIEGAVYERRLMRLRTDGRLLGFQHRQWLLEHQTELPELMALLGKVYVDFPGIVVVDDDGSRNVPYAGQDGKRWATFWFWLNFDFVQSGRVAVSSK